MNIRREASSGSPDFSSPAKQYKVSRWHVLVDTFTHEAIRILPGPALSLKQCVGAGDGRRDSDRDSDSSGSVKADAVAGTFKQH